MRLDTECGGIRATNDRNGLHGDLGILLQRIAAVINRFHGAPEIVYLRRVKGSRLDTKPVSCVFVACSFEYRIHIHRQKILGFVGIELGNLGLFVQLKHVVGMGKPYPPHIVVVGPCGGVADQVGFMNIQPLNVHGMCLYNDPKQNNHWRVGFAFRVFIEVVWVLQIVGIRKDETLVMLDILRIDTRGRHFLRIHIHTAVLIIEQECVLRAPITGDDPNPVGSGNAWHDDAVGLLGNFHPEVSVLKSSVHGIGSGISHIRPGVVIVELVPVIDRESVVIHIGKQGFGNDVSRFIRKDLVQSFGGKGLRVRITVGRHALIELLRY